MIPSEIPPERIATLIQGANSAKLCGFPVVFDATEMLLALSELQRLRLARSASQLAAKDAERDKP